MKYFYLGIFCTLCILLNVSVSAKDCLEDNSKVICEKKLEAKKVNNSAYKFEFQTIDGKPMPLSKFNGKVLVVVNTASQCGFTGQYRDLQAIYDDYKERGLVVIGVPCNQFASQEPAPEETIAEFVSKQYGITFPLTSKVNVKGQNIHPFFKWATNQKKGGILFSKPRWNFHKFLVDRQGNLAASFGSQVNPSSQKMRNEIERLLKADNNDLGASE